MSLRPGRIRVLAIQEMLDPEAGRRVAVVQYEAAKGVRTVTMSVERCAQLRLFQAARDGTETDFPER